MQLVLQDQEPSTIKDYGRCGVRRAARTNTRRIIQVRQRMLFRWSWCCWEMGQVLVVLLSRFEDMAACFCTEATCVQTELSEMRC